MAAADIELPEGLRETAIAAKDAVRYVDHPDNQSAVYGMSRYALQAVVAAAFAAGRESMLPKPKPPIVYVKPRGNCAVCGKELALKADGRVRGHDSPKVKGARWSGYCPGSRKPPKAVSA